MVDWKICERMIIEAVLLERDFSTGKLWERIWASSVNGEVINGRELIDVKMGNRGWSNKSKIHGGYGFFSCVCGRITQSDLGSVGKVNRRLVNIGNDPNDIGKEILDIYNGRIHSAFDEFPDSKMAFMLREKGNRSFVVFEGEIEKYEVDSYVWKWEKNTSLHGYGKSSQKKFSWTPSGGQFSIYFEVPPLTKIVSLKNIFQNIEESKARIGKDIDAEVEGLVHIYEEVSEET